MWCGSVSLFMLNMRTSVYPWMSGKLHSSLRRSWQYQDNSCLSLAACFVTAKTDMNACTVSGKFLWARPLQSILNLTISHTYSAKPLIQDY